MKKIGIYYGSSNGTTESVAERIAAKLGVDAANVHNVAAADPSEATGYDLLVIGSSTWGAGELQDDMAWFLPKLAGLDLRGKTVALFGCGDSSSFSSTFCDAIGLMWQMLQQTGCAFIGATDASDYTYDSSMAEEGGKFVGLALDEMNEEELSDDRIERWCESIKAEM